MDPLLIGLGLEIGSKVLGGILGNKARNKERRARQARAEIEKLRNYQARRDFLRKFTQAQAVSVIRGAAQGVDVTSSLIQGELASQETQARVGTLEQNKMGTLADTANANLDKAGRYAFASDLFNVAGSIAGAYPWPSGKTVSKDALSGVEKKNE